MDVIISDERGKESSVPQEKSKEELVKSNEELREQLRQLREEMENMKTAVSFSEVAKQEEIQEVEKKCELDVLSLRRIMKGKALSHPLVAPPSV